VTELVALNRHMYNVNNTSRLGGFLGQLRDVMHSWWHIHNHNNQGLCHDLCQIQKMLTDYVVGPCDKEPTVAWVCCPDIISTYCI